LPSHAIELTLVRSKTASKGGEPERVTIPRAGNQAAVAIIKRYIEGAGIKQGTALFRRIWKSGGVGPRLSAQSVNLIAKRIVGHEYSGHSLRVGFAVSAAEAGVDLRSIATVTRHTSMEMPKRYAERADQLRTSPYKVAGVGLSSEAEQVRL
jgi:site-specific recombinase XerD